jgi:hypothetical protein
MQTAGGDTRDLTLQDQSIGNEISFVVREGNNVFTDYGVSHTKEMHLIVVRDDLQHFQHLHPERDSQGVWRVPFAPSVGGDYWLYADFVEQDEAPHTIRFERSYQGERGAYGVVKNLETVKTIEGYRFEVQPSISDDEVSFVYKINDSQGQTVELEEYLGATGHSVLISPSGDFIHTHPSDEGETPVFATSMPSDDFYRAFTQFKIKGEVVTIDFDWQKL